MGLLKHAQNFIITKNKDTVKLNFCKIEYSFIVTEINHYCETTRGDINFWKASFLSPRAYILIYGIKWKKKIFFQPPKLHVGGGTRNFFGGKFF